MLKALIARWQQGRRTIDFPPVSSPMPERYRGRPVISAPACEAFPRSCDAEHEANALRHPQGEAPRFDLGLSLFSPEEARACPAGGVRFSTEYAMATRTREALRTEKGPVELASALDEQARRLFGHSLKLRSVSAGSCNGCEAELVALNNVVFDLARFGIQFVASPRHADGLIVTGAVSRNMLSALEKTYRAIPEPRIVVAVGACAIGGGPFRESPEVLGGVPAEIPVDLYVPGCPPHPLTILDGLLRLLGRIQDGKRPAP